MDYPNVAERSEHPRLRSRGAFGTPRLRRRRSPAPYRCAVDKYRPSSRIQDRRHVSAHHVAAGVQFGTGKECAWEKLIQPHIASAGYSLAFAGQQREFQAQCRALIQPILIRNRSRFLASAIQRGARPVHIPYCAGWVRIPCKYGK
jgi:hypothetical protein